MIMFHGTTRDSFPRHVGLCLAETAAVAARYAGPRGTVFRVVLDEDRLSWVKIPGYDRDRDASPGDRPGECASLAAKLEVDAVWFGDEDPHGQGHDTLRLITTEAVEAIVEVAEVDA